MDANGFDHLTRTLSHPSARRGLLAFLAALPVPGGLLALLGDEVVAKKRKDNEKDKDKDKDKERNRDQHASDHGQGSVAADGKNKNKRKKQKRKKKKCKKRRRTICTGQCGQITFKCNKRKKTVDCGSCACQPACPACQRCNEANRTCEPDPNQRGNRCGQPGQVCQSNGTCRCDANSCGECGTCGEDGTCGELCGGVGCCDGTTCQQGNSNDACGKDGGACEVCSGGDTCEDGVCACTPITTCPPPLDCGEISNECGGTLNCGDCTLPDTCGGGGTDNVCGCTPTTCEAQGKNCGQISDGCGGTLDCGTCSNPDPICVNNVCRVCTAQRPCPNGCCDSGSCLPGNSNEACGTDGEICTVCSGQEICQNGACVCVPITTCPAPLDCGTISDGCGGTLDCGTCSNPDPICDENVCRTCSAQRPCPSGQFCADDGSCRQCDVCPGGDCPFFSVQAAIIAASPGSTLHICAGAYPSITVDKELTIIGAGRGSNSDNNTIIDAEGNGAAVDIPTGVTATLSDLRITGGNSSGVLCLGDVTMDRCVVIDNTRFTGAGGGGLLSGGSATLNDCVVRNNEAFQAGGIHHEGTGTLTLNNTLVTRNRAEANVGGGMVLGNQPTGTGTVQIISGSAITHNTSGGNGGGLYVTPFAVTTLDSSVEITENDALCGDCGGGIFAEPGANIDLRGATVEGNEPKNCVGLNC